MKNKLILVTGNSASGKTHLSNQLSKMLGGKINLISQDRFYKNDGAAETNYDIPEAFDFKNQKEVIRSLLNGKDTEIPIYDFVTHSIIGYEEIKPQKYVILEGIFAFFDKEINKMADLKIFVDTPSDTCLSRRIVRDYKKRGRKIEDIIKRWLTHVQPAYHNFIVKSKSDADIIVPWHKIKPNSLKSLIASILSLDKSLSEILKG